MSLQSSDPKKLFKVENIEKDINMPKNAASRFEPRQLEVYRGGLNPVVDILRLK